MSTISIQRKLLFSLFLVLASWFLLEGSAFLLFRVVYGVALPRSANRESIAGLAKASAAGFEEREEEPPPGDLFRNLVLHPYLGFAKDLGQSDRAGNPLLGWTREEMTRSEDRLIVGIFGGSFAWWMNQDGGKSLADALQSATGREVELRNFSWGGYKQPQQLLALTYLLSMGAEFDVVINVDGFNEVAIPPAEHMRQGVFPNYPRSWNVLVGGIDSPASLRLLARIGLLEERRIRWAGFFEKTGLDFSNLGLLVWKFRDARLDERVTALYQDLGESQAGRDEFRLTGPTVNYPDGDAVYAALAGWWRDSSLQMHRICDANGIQYVHVLQPNQYVADSKPMGKEERAIAIDPDHIYREGAILGYPLLIEAGAELRREGVAFEDLTRVFKDETKVLYKDSCCHLNAEGNRQIALVVAELIATTRVVAQARLDRP